MQGKFENKSHVIGLDPGASRCGVARASAGTSIAFPVGILNTEPRNSIGERILGLVGSAAPSLIVCGLPIELSGREGSAAAFARELASEIARQLDCGVEFIDERFTSEIALKNRAAWDKSKKGKMGRVDAEAAALILQTYLDRQLLGS